MSPPTTVSEPVAISPKVYENIPPLRADPFTPDEHDARRVSYVRQFWDSQDAALRLRDRQIEENIRMLCGQQWSVWSPVLNRFVDLWELSDTKDDRWAQQPVLNKLLYWYILTHSRLTENPPVLAFQPATGDRIDAELAEVADPIFKTKWREAGMLEVIDRMVAWLIPGGRAYLKSRIDPNQGEILTFRGPAQLSLAGPDGQPMQFQVPDAAYGPDGQLLTEAWMDEEGIGYGEPEGVAPHVERKGALVVDVLSPLEVRGQWGNGPWHQKPWHLQRSYLTPEQVYETWGLDVEPDVRGADAQGTVELQQMMLGSGFYGSASGDVAAEFSGGAGLGADEFVSVYELWQAPCRFPGMQETETEPGGRLMVVCGDQVARDGQRFGRFPYTSPIRCFDFVNIPGRPSGTSVQEMLNPAQRAFNRTTGQILKHAALNADPIAIIHESTGISDEQWRTEPGEALVVATAPGVDPVVFIAPPALGEDAWRSQAFLSSFLGETGHTQGAEGTPPTRDPSGELVKELRYNSDRPIASTARRAALEFARMAEDWFVLLPLMMDEDDVLSYAGEDQVTRTLMVRPELFEQGQVNVQADTESMLPEGRGERQERIWVMYQNGVFGVPGSPEATKTFLELARFPHMGRTMLPGGVHRVTAQQENGKLVRGVPADEIPVMEWYDHAVHLAVHEEFMASPEYLKLSPQMQAQFVVHRAQHQMAQMILAQRQLAIQGALTQTGQATGALPPPAAPKGASGSGAPEPMAPTPPPGQGQSPLAA